jgi:hypothetical protein
MLLSVVNSARYADVASAVEAWSNPSRTVVLTESMPIQPTATARRRASDTAAKPA